MKIGAQLQLAMENIDKQVKLAKEAGSEVILEAKDIANKAKEARVASGSLGNNVNVEA